MIRKYFNALSVREKLLLSVFLWIGVIIWAGAGLKDFERLRIDYVFTAAELLNQEEMFNNQDVIEQDLADALTRVDAKQTFGSSQLVGKLDTLARNSNLNFDINTPSTQRGETFNIHTVRIQFKKAEIGELIEFERHVKTESPYLGLKKVQISANKADPRYLTAQFVVSSFELTNPTL